MTKQSEFLLFSDSSDSAEDYAKSTKPESGSDGKKGGVSTLIKPNADIPEGHLEFDRTRIGTLECNTIIQYRETSGKLIKCKYFKKHDSIAGTIIVGFYTHNKKNYAESLQNITSIYVPTRRNGGSDMLKETLEIPNQDWIMMRRDMVVSYQKKDDEYVYKAKFNSFIKGSDGSTRMSLTSERGYNFTVNPDNIKKIYRHVTGNDKTLTYILEALRKLEIRIRALEQKK